MRLAPEDHARVAAAITAAETATDGEIMALVAPRSDPYHDVALIWSALVAFLALAVYAAFPDFYIGLLDRAAGRWDRAWTPSELLTILSVALALKFLGTWAILLWRPLRLALTPRAVRARRVRAHAIALFRAAIEARTASRTGVLVYLSLDERQAEIVADAAIAAKVSPESWGAAMAALVDEVRAGRTGAGLAAAVAAAGAILAEHFPYTGSDPQELPDRLIEL